MRVAFFDTHRFEREIFEQVFKSGKHSLKFLEPRLDAETVELARGCDAVCSFVNDRLDQACLQRAKELGIRVVALRSAGFNHVDLKAAKDLQLPVVRVPAYSPYAVAEHSVALLMTLNRKIHRAYARVRELNFSLEGLVGFDLHGKTVGVLGMGRIGAAFASIMKGFGCRVIAFDKMPDAELAKKIGVEYVPVETIWREADVISLHLPLTPETRHMVNAEALKCFKPNTILLNTGRGGLIDSAALVEALKKKAIGGAGLDVYEIEEGVFFNDLSERGLDDDQLARLLTFPNVVITSHQGFLTKEALTNIATETLFNLDRFQISGSLENRVQ